MGRWPSRDPITILGGPYFWLSRDGEVFMQYPDLWIMATRGQEENLYRFVLNNPMNHTDPYGLMASPPPPPKEGDYCCVDPCDIKNIKIKDNGSSEIWIKLKLKWKASKKKCKSITPYWWTCTWNQSYQKSKGNKKYYPWKDLGNPLNDTSASASAVGVRAKVEYLTCKNNKWTKEKKYAGNTCQCQAVMAGSSGGGYPKKGVTGCECNGGPSGPVTGAAYPNE